MMPISIAVIPKGREQLRVELSEYKGAVMFSARCYYQDKAGDTRPGRNGINIKVELLGHLARAVVEAASRADREGLIPEANKHDYGDDSILTAPATDPAVLGFAVPKWRHDYAEAMSNDLDPTDDPTRPGE